MQRGAIVRIFNILKSCISLQFQWQVGFFHWEWGLAFFQALQKRFFWRWNASEAYWWERNTVILVTSIFLPTINWRAVDIQSKEISPEYLLEVPMLKLQYFGHLIQRTDSMEKTLMLGKIKGRKRRRRQRRRWLDGITDSMDMSLNKL